MEQNTALAQKNDADMPLGYQGAFSSSSNFEAAQRMAMALVTSSMVPKHYQGKENLGNAIIALEMSQRIGASPLMVMQNLYLVHGSPGWSAKFLIATFNQCGRFSAIRYEWTEIDKNDADYGCRAYTTEKATGEKIYGPWITWKLVKAEGWDGKNGSKWRSMPEKMFAYRAAAWMIDTIAPEISMGLQTEDQLHDVYDVDQKSGVVTGHFKMSGKASSLDDLIPENNAVPEAEEVDTETGEITGSPNVIDVDQLLKLIEGADSVECLDDIAAMAESLDKRTADYKDIMSMIGARRSEFDG